MNNKTLMNIKLHLLGRALAVSLLSAPFGAAITSCVDNSDTQEEDSIAVAFDNIWPEGMDPSGILSATLNLRELNTGATYTVNPMSSTLATLPLGVYDYTGSVTVAESQGESVTVEKTLRTVGSAITINVASRVVLTWFYSNPGGSLVFSEIYAAGSPNATATGGLRDSYIRIYNNSDRTVYADGIGIAESAFVNSRTNAFEILTPANNRQVNFTAGTIWVIPGSGTDHPIAPGESIKIVDQAIDWSAQVAGALDHTDSDFEWHDDNRQDTDNPQVADLDKWFCYSNTIWIMSNQCNRSYALVKFPEGMSAETYLAQYHGAYEYIHTTGAQMTNDRAYLIPNEWILDGVNLSNDVVWVYGALGNSVDISYASISTVDKDPNRFGHVFRRKEAAEVAGVKVLQDTNDSRADFTLVRL